MPKVCYEPKDFRDSTLAVIDQANEIIDEYTQEGYQLTLRQLYYQFVARDLLANRQRNYKRLGSIVNDGRLAGLIDWEAIEDRTRNLEDLAHWRNPTHILSAVAEQFRTERWKNQPCRVEMWVEKQALAGVFQRVCEDLDVPWFACRGYVSQSEMWAAAQRLIGYEQAGQDVFVLHFGDHDPSGLDMTRDIADRLRLFGCNADIDRLALNMDQVDAYGPPPNPAKTTDSRYATYIRSFGRESWELDALDPRVLSALVRDAVDNLRDQDQWDQDTEDMEGEREALTATAKRWEFVKRSLNGDAS